MALEVLLKYHWKVGVGLPVTVTPYDLLCPMQAESLVDCHVITGAVLTVNDTVLDVAEGLQVPLTTQRY